VVDIYHNNTAIAIENNMMSCGVFVIYILGNSMTDCFRKMIVLVDMHAEFYMMKVIVV